MANPNPYNPSYSFSDWQTSNPAKPLPAPQIDNELANISSSLNAAITALNQVRRSDGKLANGIVTFESLNNDLKAGYSGGAVSAWAPIVDYATGIVAQALAPATLVFYQGESYVCIVAHTTTALFDVTKWHKIASRGVNGTGSGDMLASLNLSDLANKPQARINLGLGNVDNTNDAGKPISTATQAALDVLTAKLNDPWYSLPIGIPFPLMTHKGASAPPTNQSYRYIKLTASDAYNTGILTSESVSGSAPLVIATAVISDGLSPMNGQTVNLWNTEGRIPRAGATAGVLQNDAYQDHAHFVIGSDGTGGGVAIINSGGGGLSPNNKTGGATVAATGGTPRVANETRMKNEAVTYYMRIR